MDEPTLPDSAKTLRDVVTYGILPLRIAGEDCRAKLKKAVEYVNSPIGHPRWNVAGD
jgi:hypothetical protein